MSDFIIDEVCLPSSQSPSKDLLVQLASTFFSLAATICTISDLEQHATCSMRKKKSSLSACTDVKPSLRYISPAPGWRITSHSLFFYFFLLLLFVLGFYSTSPFTCLKPVRTLPHFVRMFLGLPKFLVFFLASREREREAETGN